MVATSTHAAAPLPFVASRESVRDAAALVACHGAAAGLEAAARADRSRALGNHIRFCHWRQIERLIVYLATERPLGTLH